MKDQLVFNVNSAATIADSDSVGAYVRANDGALITKHSISEALKAGLITQGLVFKSKLAGAIGNTYSFQVIDGGGSGPLSFTEVAGDIVLDLVGLTPTVAQVVAALASNTYVDVSAGIPTGNVIVAGALSFSGGEDTNFHKYLDVYSALADGEGNPISSTSGALDVNITNAIEVDTHIDGVYVSPDNVDPDSAGCIFHTRATTPDKTNQTARSTVGGLASIASANLGTVHALDVNSFLYAINDDSGDAELLTKNDTSGGLNVHIAGSDLVQDVALANSAIKSTADSLAAAGTAEKVVSSNLTDRKYLFVYNNYNRKIFIGASDVDKDNGFPVSPGSYLELRAGASVDVYYDSEASGATIRTLELS